jgi:hypothetical protein
MSRCLLRSADFALFYFVDLYFVVVLRDLRRLTVTKLSISYMYLVQMRRRIAYAEYQIGVQPRK